MQNHCHNLGTNNFQSEITITEQLYQSAIPVIIHDQILMQLLTIVRPKQAISVDKDKAYMSLSLPMDAILPEYETNNPLGLTVCDSFVSDIGNTIEGQNLGLKVLYHT